MVHYHWLVAAAHSGNQSRGSCFWWFHALFDTTQLLQLRLVDNRSIRDIMLLALLYAARLCNGRV